MLKFPKNAQSDVKLKLMRTKCALFVWNSARAYASKLLFTSFLISVLMKVTYLCLLSNSCRAILKMIIGLISVAGRSFVTKTLSSRRVVCQLCKTVCWLCSVSIITPIPSQLPHHCDFNRVPKGWKNKRQKSLHVTG